MIPRRAKNRSKTATGRVATRASGRCPAAGIRLHADEPTVSHQTLNAGGVEGRHPGKVDRGRGVVDAGFEGLPTRSAGIAVVGPSPAAVVYAVTR